MLSALLLGAAKSESDLDRSLESIFKTSAKAAPTSTRPTPDAVKAQSHIPDPLIKKRKRHDMEDPALSDETKKRAKKKGKQEPPAHNLSAVPSTSSMRSKKMQVRLEPPPSNPTKNLSTSKVSLAKSLKGPQNDIKEKVAPPPVCLDEQREVRRDEDASEDERTREPPLHETITSNGVTPSVAKSRRSIYVPEGETRELRDARTVFIGNVPVEVARSKHYQKALKRHLTALCAPPTPDGPSPKIDSIRFRSVAFKIPTTKLPTDDDTPNEKLSTIEHRQRDRTTLWKSKSDQDLDEVDPAKTYLTPAQKKKVAFIKGELHDEAESINAYVVFAHPHPVNQRDEKERLGSQSIMDPFAAAKLLVARGDGSSFMNRTLRVDLVRSLEEGGTTTHGFDPHFTIFVGSLDFTAREEDLRVYFESVVVAEQGPPPEDLKSWVQGVRIIRDKDTQLGKGFAYVKFANRSCVDEIVSMEAGKLKFAKRKLRVQRCKGSSGPSLPDRVTKGSKKRELNQKGPAPKPGERNSASDPVRKHVKGDPKLGERLKGLSKEERKEAKKSDAIRQARRLEKKKAKVTLEKAMSGKEKERVRTRKTKQTIGLKKGGKYKKGV